MTEPAYSNKRIAKNTLFLYIRMFIVLIISLYTSRLLLNALGIVDYGIYNVVGGIVTLFTFVTGAMSTSSQRYITFALGQQDEQRLKEVFRSSLQVFVLLSLLILLLSETIGLWFLYFKMTIPAERMTAAFWVYQISILSCVLGMLVIPFRAEIIAHERMNAFAFISIMDVVLKLFIVIIISLMDDERLIFYAVLMFLITFLNNIIYMVYCKKQFKEINYKMVFNKPLLKEMGNFAGWSLIGNLAGVLYNHGVNILLNMFFGPAINAARGIAIQVQGTIQGFIINFQMAVNPQITKTYATNDLNRMHNLIIASSKFSFFLLFLLTLPIILETNQILVLWLKLVPEHTINFIRIIFFIMLIDTLANPLIIANQATGKIKKYQTVVGGILLSIVPISYIALKLGSKPEMVFIIQLIIAIIAQIARVIMIRPLINISYRKYLKEIVFRSVIVMIVASILPIYIYQQMDENLLRLVCLIICCSVSIIITILLLGLSNKERVMIYQKWQSFRNKKHI